MRISNFLNMLFAALLMAGLGACSDEEIQPVTFSPEELSLHVGNVGSVTIAGGKGEYHVLSSNEEVATGAISGNELLVTAIKEGDAVLTVTDKEGNTGMLPVKVALLTFHFTLQDQRTQVKATDENIQAIIEKELTDKAPLKEKDGYFKLVMADRKMDKGSLEVYATADDKEPKKGTFIRAEEEGRPFVFSYDGQERTFFIGEKYLPQVNDGTRSSSPNTTILLTENQTEYYQKKYPEAGVTEAYFVMRLTSSKVIPE